MLDLFLIAFAICCIQLEGTYIRFLAFCKDMPLPHIKKMWWHILQLSLCLLPLYMYIFSVQGISALYYKAILFTGWLPYQLLMMYHIRGRKLEHLFVFSMYALWSFILHNFSNIMVAILMMENDEAFVLESHALLFSLWFLLALPLSKACFGSLLPAFALVQSRWIRIYTALMPLLALLGFLLLIADSQLWHSWEERLARLVLPIAFVFSYHFFLKSTQRLYEQNRLKQKAAILEQESAYLEEGRLMAARSLQEARHQQENLLAIYEKLRQLIQSGQLTDARALIAHQNEKLSASSITPYTDYPIVNASISIYLKRAEENGIKVSQKVNLPKAMHTDENELALLLANLLENALLACQKEQGRREINLILQHREGQCVVEITNTCTIPLRIGEDGLPKTTRGKGHGLGMLSLRNFLKKYDGYADFSQEDGIVNFSMYWEDKPC